MSAKRNRKRTTRSRRTRIPRGAVIQGPLRATSKTTTKEKASKANQDQTIIKPPPFIKVRDSIRDLECEENGLYHMYPKVGALKWPPDNFTRVMILKIVEYYVALMENGEIGARFPWSW